MPSIKSLWRGNAEQVLINRTVTVTPHCHCKVHWVTGGTRLFLAVIFFFYWASCSQLLLEAGNLSKLWGADPVCALNWLCFSTYSHGEVPPAALWGGWRKEISSWPRKKFQGFGTLYLYQVWSEHIPTNVDYEELCFFLQTKNTNFFFFF